MKLIKHISEVAAPPKFYRIYERDYKRGGRFCAVMPLCYVLMFKGWLRNVAWSLDHWAYGHSTRRSSKPFAEGFRAGLAVGDRSPHADL